MTSRTLRIVPFLVALTSSCGMRDATPPPPTAQPQPTQPATPPTGALLEQEGVLDREAARHPVRVNAGDRIRVTLTSRAFDPMLEVVLPDGNTLSNDDFRGDRARSELELLVPTAGELKVGVRGEVPESRGAYHLAVVRLPRGTVASRPASLVSSLHHQTQLPGGQPGVTGTVATPPAALPCRVGDRVQGTLAAGDPRLASGEFSDVYELVLTEPMQLRIQMASTALDSFLLVQPPSGPEVRNDDSGGTRNAEVVLDATPGTYRIVATSYRAGETGAYELKLLRGRPDAAPPGVAAATDTEQTSRGDLAEGDSRLRSGEFYDEHTLSLTSGQRVHIEARSSAFDTYLILRPPTGPQQDNDDQVPGNTNAALDFVATETGPHRVMVTSYRPGERGAYELVVRGASSAAGAATPPAQPGQPTPPAPAAPAVSPLGAQRGNLAAGDRTLQSGEFVDTFPMQFAPGSPVRLRAESSAFDTYLIVRTPSGQQLDNDDPAPGDTNAVVEIPSAEAGTYQVMVTSYRPGETGAYTLTTGGGGGGAPVGPGTPAAPGGTTDTRVWTVSVGISDYPGGGNDLPECANDAVKIAQALRRQNLTDANREILLTDAQATRANVRQALERVAQNIQPNDVFVFFYSGHGGQARGQSQDAQELDHIDEYLYLYDGEFLDDEMGRLVSAIRSRTTLFALDACFSGGFAKDVVTRPGIVGMFSSEEDVTSGVAQQFQAGGYLSHFLRMGIGGEADRDPRDGAMTVGELTHYVWQQYGRQASDVRMQEGYQQLVIDRGAVRTAQVLWRSR